MDTLLQHASRVLIGSVLTASCWLIVGCRSSPVVATFQGGEVTADEYASWLRFHDIEEDSDQERGRHLTDIASRKALAAAAEEAGRQKTISVRMALLDADALRLQKALLAGREDALTVTDEEVDAGFDALGGPVVWPVRVRLQNLFKRIPEGASPGQVKALQNRMEALRQELADGTDFALLASAESESQTRFRGGNMGFVKPGQLDPVIEEIAFALEKGGLSPVIETHQGFTILRCEDRKEAEVQDPEVVRDRVRGSLLRDKKRALKSELQEAWLVGVTIDVESLQLTSVRGDAAVLHMGDDHVLTTAEVKALLAGRGLRVPVTELTPKGLRAKVESIARSLRAAQLAREQRLDGDREVADGLRWDRLGILATAEISDRIQGRFPPVTDVEIRAHFEAHGQRFRYPESYHLAAIAWRTTLAALPEKHAEARSVAADLAAGRVSFAEAAAEHSDLPSAHNSGLLGWLDKKRMASLGPWVSRVVQRLEPGEISDLVEQQEDLRGNTTLWIVQLIDRRPARPMTLEESARRAKNEVGSQRLKELERQVLDELAAELNLQISADRAG